MKSERTLISTFLSNYDDQPAVQGKVLDILILIGLNYASSHLTKHDLLLRPPSPDKLHQLLSELVSSQQDSASITQKSSNVSVKVGGLVGTSNSDHVGEGQVEHLLKRIDELEMQLRQLRHDEKVQPARTPLPPPKKEYPDWWGHDETPTQARSSAKTGPSSPVSNARFNANDSSVMKASLDHNTPTSSHHMNINHKNDYQFPVRMVDEFTQTSAATEHETAAPQKRTHVNGVVKKGRIYDAHDDKERRNFLSDQYMFGADNQQQAELPLDEVTPARNQKSTSRNNPVFMTFSPPSKRKNKQNNRQSEDGENNNLAETPEKVWKEMPPKQPNRSSTSAVTNQQQSSHTSTARDRKRGNFLDIVNTFLGDQDFLQCLSVGATAATTTGAGEEAENYYHNAETANEKEEEAYV